MFVRFILCRPIPVKPFFLWDVGPRDSVLTEKSFKFYNNR